MQGADIIPNNKSRRTRIVPAVKGRRPGTVARTISASAHVFIFLLLIAFHVDAKTRHYGQAAGDGRLSTAEIEAKFRPFLEQKISAKNSRRGGGRGISPARNNAARPAQNDFFALMRAWDGLSPEFRALYKRASDIEPGDYQHFHISPSGKFKIYYSTSGPDSVNVTDTMGYGGDGAWRDRRAGPNGVPDYIDEAAFALDSAWSMIVDRFGFVEPVNAPDPDGAADFYSVIIYSLEDYGGTWPYERRAASGPGFSSYIEVNSDWSGPDWRPLGYDLRPLDALRVTCAHEFMHAVQYAMVYTENLDNLPIGWLEGTAVLMEETAFPDVNDYLQYVAQFFRSPKITLLGNSNIYENSILHKYLYEKTNPGDSIGLVKAVHFNSYAQRMLAFHRNIEAASQEYAQKSWAEVLNGFHAESYFTGKRARRPWAFVSDAELMGMWAAPTTPAPESETKTVRPNSVEFFRYTPQNGSPDTLILHISGQRDQNITGKTWGASALVMEGGDSVGIVQIPLDQNGSGYLALAGWKEKAGCLVVTTNGSRNSSRSVTVSMADSVPPPPPPPDTSQLNIYPNVVKIGSGKPVRIYGGNISEVKVIAQNGKILGYYNSGALEAPAFRKAADGVLEWRPNRRLVPGVCFISVTSQKPDKSGKNTRRQKIMILP